MKIIIQIVLWLLLTVLAEGLKAQEQPANESELEQAKRQIIFEEKALLLEEVEKINAQIANQTLSKTEAQRQKEALAKKHAENIENRILILETKDALGSRNSKDYPYNFANKSDTLREKKGFDIDFPSNRRKNKYDIRTKSGPVIAAGFNTALSSKTSVNDAPYNLYRSRFLEIGWNWRTRLLKNSYAIRVLYGFSFEFNGLNLKNQVFVEEDGVEVLIESPLPLKKSKLRMDNFVLPIHFEFGPSESTENAEKIRFSIRQKFKFGIGGYGGFAIKTRQKLKYGDDSGERVKEKINKGSNRQNLIYGVSSYVGFGDTALYLKYELSPVFKNSSASENMLALGIRFDL